MKRWLLSIVIVAAGCGDSADSDPRDVSVDTMIDASGLSEEIAFRIPEATRSVTIVVEGSPDTLYALGAFTLADGVDLVALPPGAPGPAMETSYRQEQVGQMPGMLFQSIRLGTFTHVYPYAPDQALVAGPARVRVAANQPGRVSVRVLMPEDDGGLALPLNFYLVSDTLADPNVPLFAAELDRIFAQASIRVTINGVERLPGTALSRITDFNEPQEIPTSQSAMLTGLVQGRPPLDGLDVFFVDRLPFGVAGLSLGTPGPPVRGSYYYGVVLRGGYPAPEMARVAAHEIAHFLALQHVENRGISGTTYPDPLADTIAGVDNLMSSGTVLTAGQALALSRSALLTR